MLNELLVFGAIILVSLTAIYILSSRDWRYCLIAFAVQYIGIFLLVEVSWPIEMAIVKPVTGWMAGAILGIAMVSIPKNLRDSAGEVKFGPVFRIFASAILVLAIASLIIHSSDWLPLVSVPLKWGSFLLIGIGLLQLSLTSHPLRVIIGLLTVLSGFEVMYSAIEASTLVTGLLAGVELGLALVGAYLLIAPTMEASK